MQIRVNKYISESGYCSRREADKYIEQGYVTIDGKIAEIGSQVSPGQVVKVFGETISNTGKKKRPAVSTAKVPDRKAPVKASTEKARTESIIGGRAAKPKGKRIRRSDGGK